MVFLIYTWSFVGLKFFGKILLDLHYLLINFTYLIFQTLLRYHTTILGSILRIRSIVLLLPLMILIFITILLLFLILLTLLIMRLSVILFLLLILIIINMEIYSLKLLVSSKRSLLRSYSRIVGFFVLQSLVWWCPFWVDTGVLIWNQLVFGLVAAFQVF
jgi:hypothetical protein